MRIICLIPDNNEAVKYAVKFTFDVKVYGKAEVKSFGTSFQDGKYYHAIFLKYNGEEVVYKIPCYREDVNG